MTPATKLRGKAKQATAAEQVVARLDSYPQDAHVKGIQAARDRTQARKVARRQAARDAVQRMSNAS